MPQQHDLGCLLHTDGPWLLLPETVSLYQLDRHLRHVNIHVSNEVSHQNVRSGLPTAYC